MARRGGGDDSEWSPARHRVVSGEEIVELLPALAGRAPSAGYHKYDCQTDDGRHVRAVRGEYGTSMVGWLGDDGVSRRFCRRGARPP